MRKQGQSLRAIAYELGCAVNTVRKYLEGDAPPGYPMRERRQSKLAAQKITKNRGSFPSDEALSKLFYLALRNISQKWNMPIRDWKAALNRFSIEFQDRAPQH